MAYIEVEVDVKIRMSIPDRWFVTSVERVLQEINHVCESHDVIGTPKIDGADDVMMKQIRRLDNEQS